MVYVVKAVQISMLHFARAKHVPNTLGEHPRSDGTFIRRSIGGGCGNGSGRGSGGLKVLTAVAGLNCSRYFGSDGDSNFQTKHGLESSNPTAEIFFNSPRCRPFHVVYVCQN